eukprot:9491-Eustigmatos_ZCMA.PRE.1
MKENRLSRASFRLSKDERDEISSKTFWGCHSWLWCNTSTGLNGHLLHRGTHSMLITHSYPHTNPRASAQNCIIAFRSCSAGLHRERTVATGG